MKKRFFYLFSLYLLFTINFSGPIAAGDIPVISVGIYENAPKIYTNENGVASGFWPDLIRHIAAEEGWEIKWIAGTWPECLKRLESGEIKLMPDTGWTEPRSKRFAFSAETVLTSWSRLYVPRDSNIETIIDLDGKTIAALKGSFNLSGPEGIKKIVQKFDLRVDFLEMESYEQVFRALENRKIDAGVTNKDFGNQHESDYEVERTSIIFQPARMQFAFPKDSNLTPYLVEKIDAHMKKLKKDKGSVYFQALEKHIGSKVTETTAVAIPGWVKTALWLGCGTILFLFAVGFTARQQARRRTSELKDSESRYRELFISNPHPMWVYDLESLTFLDVNDAAILHYGYSRDEFLSMTIKDIRPPEDVPRLLDNVEQVKEGVDRAGVWRHIKKDGNIIEVEITSHVLIFGQRRAEIVLVNDITERRRAEEALKKSEEKLRYIVENSTNLFYSHTAEHKLTYLSPQCRDFLDCEPEEAMVNWTEFATDNPNNEKGFAVTEEAIKTGKRQPSYELEVVGKKGRKLWVEVNEVPVTENGHTVAVVGSLNDITERKRAEEELRKSHQTFLTVLDGIDATVYVADMETHEILFMNRHMIDAFGADLTGKICYDVFRAETTPCDHCTNDQLVDADGNPTGVCVWETKNPITGRWYINHDRAIQWVDGRSVRLQIASDITKIKDLEMERIRTEEQLVRAQKMESIGTLAGGIAHDFNNILAAVVGYTELAQTEAEKGSSLYNNLQEVLLASGRAKDLVKQILTFSRQAEQVRKPVHVKLIAKEALKFLRASLPTTIEISQDIRSDSLVLADPTQIHQVIMNLCTNAGHAMRENGGVLEVTLKDVKIDTAFTAEHPELKPGSYLELIVSDTGHGMSPSILDRIFDPFFTTKEKYEGTGMGLSVVHGIVGSCEGSITVSSKLGQGTTFKIYLPVAERRLEFQTSTREALPTGTECILFVDDEPALVDVGKQILKSLGYEVITRTSSLEALELFKAKVDSFDLVITDMTMPNMTGVELAKEMMRINSDLPVILCTGYSARINPEQAAAMGIRAFVSKPVLIKEIAKTIRQVLDNN